MNCQKCDKRKERQNFVKMCKCLKIVFLKKNLVESKPGNDNITNTIAKNSNSVEEEHYFADKSHKLTRLRKSSGENQKAIVNLKMK